eukprot:tig00000806_g4327.t1
MAEFVTGVPELALRLVTKTNRGADPSPLPMLKILWEFAGDALLGHGRPLYQVAHTSNWEFMRTQGTGWDNGIQEFMNNRDVIWRAALDPRGRPLVTDTIAIAIAKRAERAKAITEAINFQIIEGLSLRRTDVRTAPTLPPFLRMGLDLALSEGVPVEERLDPHIAQVTIPAAAEALWRAYRRVEEAREKGGADVDPKDESLALREARSSALPVCLALTSGPAQACRLGFRLTALRLARAAPAPALDEADGEGRTPLHHAVAFGPEMLDVCTALIARGADAGRGVGEGADRQTVLQAHRDVAFLAVLKRASRLCDVYICCGDGEGEAAFAARLREGLEAAHVTCLAREDEEAPAGAEGAPASPLDFLKRASAVVFAVSPAACSSERCRSELAAARALGRAVFPVWRERSELDDEMQGFLLKQQFGLQRPVRWPLRLGPRRPRRSSLRAFVPLLSPASIRDPLLRDRLQLAELNKRPILPLLPSDLPTPSDLPPEGEPFAYIAAGNVALLANVRRLFASVPALAPAPAAAPREAPSERGPLERELEDRRRRREEARLEIESAPAAPSSLTAPLAVGGPRPADGGQRLEEGTPRPEPRGRRPEPTRPPPALLLTFRWLQSLLAHVTLGS